MITMLLFSGTAKLFKLISLFFFSLSLLQSQRKKCSSGKCVYLLLMRMFPALM